MLNIIGRSVGAYVLGTILMRFVERKSVSQLSYLDFLMSTLVGNLLSIFVTGQEKGAKLLAAPAALITSTVLIEKIAAANRCSRIVLEGKPVPLIKKGRILESNLKRQRYNANELFLQLRQKGVFDISQVEYAVLETNGKISVLRKTPYQSPMKKDLNLQNKPANLPQVIISEGKILEENLHKCGHNRKWLTEQLNNSSIMNTNGIFLAVITAEGSLYTDLYQDKRH